MIAQKLTPLGITGVTMISSEIPENSIICPHAVCDSCGKNSGPVFTLPELRNPSDFLRENITPVGLERQVFLQDIRKADEMILAIDSEINRLQQVVASHRHQREVLREFRDQGNSLFAPIRKLPEDVLRHLFITCQLDFEDDSDSEGFIDVCHRKYTFVETIMNVCAYWRVVARSFPELWSRLKIWTGGPVQLAINNFLDACIYRSGEMPLSIHISAKLDNSSIRSLARCEYRWKEIQVRHSGDLFSNIMKYIDPEVVLSSLEKLSLEDTTTSTISINPTPVLSYFCAEDNRESFELEKVSFKSAPRLQILSIENVLHPMSTFIDLPWSQITTFESIFNEYDINELALLLNSMPNLVSFTLEGVTDIKETVTLPSLKTFMLPSSDVYNRDVLDAFTAPYLEILHSELKMYSSSVFRFLTRFCCPLADLQLAETLLDIECIETCSSLRTVKKLSLVVPDPEWFNDILVLTRKDQLSGLWSHLAFPQLESLEIRWVVLEDYGRLEFSDVVEPLIHMLKSRIAPSQQSSGSEGDQYTLCSLKQVTIIFTEYLTQEEKNAFYELIRSDLVRHSGVKLNVAHRRDDCFIIRNGVAIDEETSSSDENNTDLDDSTNSSHDTNSNSDETSASSEESSALD